MLGKERHCIRDRGWLCWPWSPNMAASSCRTPGRHPPVSLSSAPYLWGPTSERTVSLSGLLVLITHQCSHSRAPPCGWLCLRAIFFKSHSCPFFESVPHFSFCMCHVKLAWLQLGLFYSHIDSITYNLQTIQKSICGHEISVRKNNVMNLFMRAFLWSIINKCILHFL